MFFKRYYVGCLAHASYLIGDQECGTAAVVDPQPDVEPYLRDAAHHHLQIRHVFLTHFHTDFVAGHLALRDRAGAQIYLGARAQAEYPFTPLAGGDVVELGRHLSLRVSETAGRSPEAIVLLAFDTRKDDRQPWGILTGDTILIGDVGRPDLLGSCGATVEELAGRFYRALHDEILTLPDETLVYPAHGAGAVCGRSLSTDTASTLGTQRRYNFAFQPMHEEDFVRLLAAEATEAVSPVACDPMLNRRAQPTLDLSLVRVLKPLGLAEILRLHDVGVQIVDVRTPADFAGAHLIDAVNIPLGAAFSACAGTLLRRDAAIVVVADPGREAEAATRLSRIGFEQAVGHLSGGMLALETRPELVRRTVRVTAVSLAEQLHAPDPPVVLDVRSRKEWEKKRIDGSVNLPLDLLPHQLHFVPRRHRLVVTCATGHRSSTATSLLRAHGVEDLSDLAGGLGAWEASRLPLAHGAARSHAERTVSAPAAAGRVPAPPSRARSI